MEATYLLDTCAWIDAFAAPQYLKPPVRRIVDQQSVIHLSSISLLEVARKEAKGDLIFGMPLADWFRLALPSHRIAILDLSPEISIDSTRLPDWQHKDPADRVIVATARVHRLVVLTSDAKILSYPHVQSLASRR